MTYGLLQQATRNSGKPKEESMATAEIALSFTKPPLNENDRIHHRVKAAKVRAIRQEVHIKAKASTIPLGLPHITAVFHYRPADNIRRDEDNLISTAKPAWDGLVDAGIVADDTPDLMTKLMPVIHAADRVRGAACWLQIDWNEADA